MCSIGYFLVLVNVNLYFWLIFVSNSNLFNKLLLLFYVLGSVLKACDKR